MSQPSTVLEEAESLVTNALVSITADDSLDPVEKLRTALRCRDYWKAQAQIACLVLTGKKDPNDKKEALSTNLQSIITALWGECGGEDVVYLADPQQWPDGDKQWKVAVVPTTWSGLSREKLILAGVTPEQLTAGTETRTGTRLDVRSVKTGAGGGDGGRDDE